MPARNLISGPWRQGLAVIVTTALAVRLIYLLLYLDSPLFELYVADQIYYRYWAMQIAGGAWLGGEIFEQGPLYAYLLGGFFKLFGPSLLPVLIVQLLAGTGTVILIWWCTLCLAGAGAALAAGLLAAIYGPFVFYECMLMKSFLEPLLVMLALAAILRADATGRTRWAGIAGLALGLACLVREIHIVLLLPLTLACLWWRTDDTIPPGKRILPALALLVCFGLTLAPATLHNWIVGREFVPVTTGGGEVLYMSFGPSANGYYAPPYFVAPHPVTEHQDFRKEAYFRTLTPMGRKESSEFWSQQALGEIAAAPGRALALMRGKAVILANDDEVPDSENFQFTRRLIPPLAFLPTFGWITGLAGLGAVILWRRSRQGRLIVCIAALLILEVLLTYNFGRFRLALCATALIFAGCGLARLCQPELWRGRNPVRRIAACAAVLLLGMLLAWIPAPRAGMASNQQALEGLALEAAEKRSYIPRLRKDADDSPADPDPRYYLGVSLWATGMVSEAIEAYHAVLTIRPDDPDTHRDLAIIYRDYGHPAIAARHAETLTRLMPEDPKGFYLAGLIALDRGVASPDKELSARYFADAVQSLGTAVQLQPLDAANHHALGKALYFTGETPAAIQQLNRALAIDPAYRQAAEDLAIISGQSGH